MDNTTKQLTTKDLFSQENVKAKFFELLGKKAQGFITSVLQSVSSNEMLKNADPHSVFHAAAVAATLDLPINNNLGFAYIVPYRDGKQGGKVVAQFQMGYKGFIQLAQRSGQFKTISAAPIMKGQLVEENPLTGFRFDFTKKDSDEIIGYAAYIELLNGFQKTLYMSKSELEKHGARFSQSFRKGFGLWKDDFDSMAQKTVIKLLLSKFAPLSIETIQSAVKSDQAVIGENGEANYVDVQEVPIPEIAEAQPLSVSELLESCDTLDKIEMLKFENPNLTTDEMKLVEAKEIELVKASKKK